MLGSRGGNMSIGLALTGHAIHLMLTELGQTFRLTTRREVGQTRLTSVALAAGATTSSLQELGARRGGRRLIQVHVVRRGGGGGDVIGAVRSAATGARSGAGGQGGWVETEAVEVTAHIGHGPMTGRSRHDGSILGRSFGSSLTSNLSTLGQDQVRLEAEMGVIGTLQGGGGGGVVVVMI